MNFKKRSFTSHLALNEMEGHSLQNGFFFKATILPKVLWS